MQNFSSQKLCHKAAVRRCKKRMQKHVQKLMQNFWLHQTVIILQNVATGSYHRLVQKNWQCAAILTLKKLAFLSFLLLA